MSFVGSGTIAIINNVDRIYQWYTYIDIIGFVQQRSEWPGGRPFLGEMIEPLSSPVARHTNSLILPKTSALSASRAAISSMISCGVRCSNRLAAVRIFHRQVKGGTAQSSTISTLHDFGESANVICISTNSARSVSLRGLVFPIFLTWIKLVKPHVLGWCAFLKKQHHRFHARPQECPTGAVQHRV